MQNRYFHDERNRTVYRLPSTPNVYEQKGRNGRCTGWSIDTEIHITRADNALKPNGQQWNYPVLHCPQEHYSSGDSKTKAISFFNSVHMPNYLEISELEFRRLEKIYRHEAEQNQY